MVLGAAIPANAPKLPRLPGRQPLRACRALLRPANPVAGTVVARLLGFAARLASRPPRSPRLAGGAAGAAVVSEATRDLRSRAHAPPRPASLPASNCCSNTFFAALHLYPLAINHMLPS